MNKSVTFIVIILLAILSVTVVFSTVNTNESVIKANLTVSSEGPVELSKVIEEIKTSDSYEGYDNETIEWMESLGSKQVFFGNGTIVIMSYWDASKLHSEFVCDAYIEQYMGCNILENRSLGDIKFPKEVLLVDNVNYLGENVSYYDV